MSGAGKEATGDQLKAAALHLSAVCGCLDAIKSIEQPKSARWNVIANLEAKMWKALDLYRLNAFAQEDLRNAADIIDMVNQKIAQCYPEKIHTP